jgi:hypothetical protein
MLMDKLELSSSAVKELVQANFGGTLQYQMISKDCHHTSVRDEPFLMLTAEVILQLLDVSGLHVLHTLYTLSVSLVLATEVVPCRRGLRCSSV